MKILGGVHQPDAREIFIEGIPVEINGVPDHELGTPPVQDGQELMRCAVFSSQKAKLTNGVHRFTKAYHVSVANCLIC